MRSLLFLVLCPLLVLQAESPAPPLPGTENDSREEEPLSAPERALERPAAEEQAPPHEPEGAVDEQAEEPEETSPDEALPEPEKEVVDDGIRVSVLGYHEFSPDLPNTQMRIKTDKFRQQIEALHNLGKPVISLEQFIKWRKGEDTIPPQSFLITIDDGWKSVYTDAYPILKEFEMPFTIFLYKNYVDGGGRALTTAMIEEMMASGLCTIGSHSVSHPFPSKFKAAARKGEEAYQNFLDEEFGASKVFLEKKFERPITTFAYPGGYYTEDMFPVAKEHGYEYLFTVDPGMTRSDTDNLLIPRYIILGNQDGVFEQATTFRATSASAAAAGLTVQTTRHPVTPEPGELIAERLPLISAQLGEEEDLDAESIVMRVAGFGKVPGLWNEEEKTFSWQVNRPLRIPVCEVTVQWRRTDKREYELPMRWSFRVDLEAAYQPR
ncbi:polysaccharide deacetylase family protein [Roseibacillus ishigakijimensis]|uniref:Polysaccharide deacetylase family protein n=1 Tax=Roseibacillus ishigakijimensis TaxID=454146 RepID=A0A934RMV2_9BACT|nr:polysaccharide deacetylase family protein [Roseibacillus ishigakijimensis]MBK1833695.1 polysaccharide deacetylase family protein [Roseibacillus ishigakijimensis]